MPQVSKCLDLVKSIIAAVSNHFFIVFHSDYIIAVSAARNANATNIFFIVVMISVISVKLISLKL